MKTRITMSGLMIMTYFMIGSSIVSGYGQDRFGVQFRPEISFPTSDLRDANLKTGFGFEVAGLYRVMPNVSAYLGWGWSSFSSSRCFAGDDIDFEETGYSLGLQFVMPFRNDFTFDYFIKGGAIYNHIEMEDGSGAMISDSGHGFGFQVEAGLAFALIDSWKLIPGIKYQTLSRRLEVDEITYPIDLNYLSVGATITRSF